MKRIHDASDAEEEICARNTTNIVSRLEGPFDHFVEECFLESYRSLLRMCEANNVMCPYLLDPILPIFKEPVLRGMDTEMLENVFRLFANHRCAGSQFFNRMLRHFPFVDEHVVDVFWTQTATLWQFDVDLPLLQQTAIVSTRPWLLRKLCFRWDRSLIPLGALHVVGNVEACQLLLHDGRFSVNNTQDWHALNFTPLYNASSKEVATCLLEARANIAQVLECSDCLPRAQVMRWIFELCSADCVWNVLWLPTSFFAKRHEEPMLEVVGLLNEFHCTIPTNIIESSLDDETKCALFTYGYIAAVPAGTHTDLAWLEWRPWTHRYFNALHKTVWSTLLCWKRLSPRLPRDVRNCILDLAFGR